MAANPPNSRRAKIINNLIRQLQTITIANDYSHDVREVSSDVRTWDTFTDQDTPTIFVVDEDTAIDGHPGKLVTIAWKVALFCIMRDESQMDMEEFISDIISCISKNTTLSFPDTGKVLSQIRVTNITSDNQFFSKIDNSQLFRVTLSLVYVTQYGER